MKYTMKIFLSFCIALLGCAGQAFASVHGVGETAVTLTTTTLGYASLILFVLDYVLVIFEEKTHLRKSKPVMMAAGLIWLLLALTYHQVGIPPEEAHNAIIHNITEYAELMLFLLAAMTYINSMDERNVFQALRSWLVSRGVSLRIVFWITGFLAFIISPVADNLTTALLMGAVVMDVSWSMAAGYLNCGCGWKSAFHWLGCRCCINGNSSKNIHLRSPFKMDPGVGLGVCSKHLCSYICK